MAIIDVSFFSKNIKRSVTFKAYLPFDEYNYLTMKNLSKPPFKTLYLLHGIFGFKEDWITYTRVIEYVKGNNLAIIMPSGENSFYIDNNISGIMYEKYFFQELVEETRKIFPLSNKKEDTYLAGLSMGGFGALRNGIIYNDIFSVVGAFSPAIPKNKQQNFPGDVFGINYNYISNNYPEYFDLYNIVLNNKDNLPKLFLGCGSEDFLIEANREFTDFLNSLEINHIYFEEVDGHTWSFWDLSIKRFIDFLK